MMGIDDTLDSMMDFNLMIKATMPQLEMNNDKVALIARDAIRPPLSDTWI